MCNPTELERFIQTESHIPDFIGRIMMTEDPLLAQLHLSGGLAGIRKNHELRRRVLERFGYAVLTRDAVERLVPYGPFIEVGAGTGYWCYELQKAGCIAIATDLYTPETAEQSDLQYCFERQPCHVDVIAMAAEDAVQEHPDKTLLMVWPELNRDWGYRALQRYAGTTLIYAGEGRGGRTGDDLLHKEIERNWREIERIQIPRFPLFNDAVFVYRRK
jgi:hypothetical protein